MPSPIRFLVMAASFAAVHGANAHDGHFLPGSHWHATDLWGLAVLAAGSVAALWLGGRGK